MSKKTSAAVIDVGSYEIRLKVGQNIKGKLKILESISYPLLLGRDTFNTGKISFEKADKCCEIISNFLRIANEYGVEAVRVVATSAIREALNSDYILDQIFLKTGQKLEVLDNSEEKFYIYKLMLSLLKKEYKQSAMMVYIGSGNMGLSIIEKERIPYVQNVKIGSLRLSELFENIQSYSSEFHIVVEEYLDSFIDPAVDLLPEGIKHFIAAGSEMDTIVGLCRTETKNSYFVIPAEKFRALYDEIKFKSVDRIKKDYQISHEKAELLLPALCIYMKLLELTESENIVSTTMLLIDSVLFEILYTDQFLEIEKEFNKSTLLSARVLANRFQCVEVHYQRVEKIACTIYDKLKKIHGMGNRERLLLQAGAILHDCGKFIHVRSHYEHSYRIVKALDIVGLSLRETYLVACLCLFHSGLIPSRENEVFKSLNANERTTVAKLVSILRIADSLDRSSEQKFDEIDVKITASSLLITILTDSNIELEQWSFNDKGAFFEEVYGLKAVLRKKRLTS